MATKGLSVRATKKKNFFFAASLTLCYNYRTGQYIGGKCPRAGEPRTKKPGVKLIDLTVLFSFSTVRLVFLINPTLYILISCIWIGSLARNRGALLLIRLARVYITRNLLFGLHAKLRKRSHSCAFFQELLRIFCWNYCTVFHAKLLKLLAAM